MSEDVKNKNNQKKSFLQSCFNSHVIFLSRSSESKLMTTKIKLLKSLRNTTRIANPAGSKFERICEGQLSLFRSRGQSYLSRPTRRLIQSVS